MRKSLFKTIILGGMVLLYAPTFGQTPINTDSLQHKVKTLFNDQQYIEESTKSVWWDIGVFEQLDYSLILPSGDLDGTCVYPWYTTIIDFKIGKTSKFYFYSQLRFGSFFWSEFPTTLGDTAKFTFGGLVGMGGKISEMYLVDNKDRSRIVRNYLNGGILVEMPRYKFSTSPLFGYELNQQSVVDYSHSKISMVYGTSFGFYLHHVKYTYEDNWGTEWEHDNFDITFSVGFHLGFIF